METQRENVIEFSILSEGKSYPDQQDLKKLATLIERFTPQDGKFDLPIPGIHAIKASKTSDTFTHMMATPGMCIVAQGGKCCSLAHQKFEYDEKNMIVYAAEVPISARITKASKDAPYLCLVIPINSTKLSEIISKVFPNGVPKSASTQAIYLGESDQSVIKSAIRLIEIILNEDDDDLLAPLMIDEILIRLLRGPSGPAIAQIGITDSHTQKISKAITWLKENFKKTIKVDELAKLAGMSTSAFHTHFKTITSMSPLQFQKALRLQEARTLMTKKMMDVSSASYEVGYTSPSQFSREYSRHFGSPPSKDVYL